MTDWLSDEAVLAAIAGELGEWRRLAQPLAARYRAPDGVAAAAFAAAVARASADAGHGAPEIRLADCLVDVHLYSVDRNGARRIAERDLRLARAVTEKAREAGLTPLPLEVTQVEFALDVADHALAGPFWAALLTGSAGNAVLDGVFDPTHRVPAVWFQQTDDHPVPRQRWHPDVWLAPEAAPARIAAAVAAGGTVVDASRAPSFTVLADPEGNRVCVCTALGRN
jgi:4a-hydroxytetrahydrobiopterin dehydratase